MGGEERMKSVAVPLRFIMRCNMMSSVGKVERDAVSG
jgi:hypothetical protein